MDDQDVWASLEKKWAMWSTSRTQRCEYFDIVWSCFCCFLDDWTFQRRWFLNIQRQNQKIRWQMNLDWFRNSENSPRIFIDNHTTKLIFLLFTTPIHSNSVQIILMRLWLFWQNSVNKRNNIVIVPLNELWSMWAKGFLFIKRWCTGRSELQIGIECEHQLAWPSDKVSAEKLFVVTTLTIFVMDSRWLQVWITSGCWETTTRRGKLRNGVLLTNGRWSWEKASVVTCGTLEMIVFRTFGVAGIKSGRETTARCFGALHMESQRWHPNPMHTLDCRPFSSTA